MARVLQGEATSLMEKRRITKRPNRGEWSTEASEKNKRRESSKRLCPFIRNGGGWRLRMKMGMDQRCFGVTNDGRKF